MKISVKAKPRAKEEKIEKIDGSNFEVWVKEPPVQGRANAAIIRALAEYFGVPQSQISIISGFASRQKVVQIGKSVEKTSRLGQSLLDDASTT